MKPLFTYLFVLFLTGFNLSISYPAILSANNFPTSFDIEGSWAGSLKISNVELRIVFNVSLDSTGKLIANLDSPDQGAYGIAVDEVIITGDSVKFIVGVVKGFYAGKFYPDSLKISGIWNQGGMSLPLDLRKTDFVEKPKRPQEPKEPFPYKSEEVKFINENTGDTLAGTFTYPYEGHHILLWFLFQDRVLKTEMKNCSGTSRSWFYRITLLVRVLLFSGTMTGVWENPLEILKVRQVKISQRTHLQLLNF
jgi:hypothetical protein